MEIAFHCPNCSADLIFDESKSYTCCFCHTVLTGKDEVKELEGGYYVGDAWNEKSYHVFHCEDCGGEFIAKPANANLGCPICASTSLKDNGGIVGPMPRRAIPFSHTRQQAQEMFLDYIRNNSAVGRTLATDENKELLHKVYVPVWLFTYEVIAHAKVTASLRNKAAESKTLFGINGTEVIAESLTAIRSSFSRFQANRKGSAKDINDGTSEHVTGGVLSWQGIPFDASGVLPASVINNLQPYDQSKMVLLNEKVLMDTPVLIMTKDPISCMQEFMERIKKWTRQMIIDAHSDSYDIAYFQDKTDYPLGIGELVLFPIWYMKGEYMGRDYFFSMNGQNGEIDANVPMTKGTSKSVGITYQQYWDKSRCTALNDTHFEFNIHDPSIEVIDYSFFEKPKESRVTPEGRIAPKSSSAVPASLDDVFETAAEALSEGKAPAAEKPVQKKKFSEMEVEIGFGKKKKDPEKPLTKEEEMQREREMIARLRAAAKEEPKDANGAASVPSWAKAVTPPPSQTSAAARPSARTKKGASATRSSAASSANKPIWEKTEEDIAAEKEASRSNKMSMAERMARKDEGEAAPEKKPSRGFTGGLGAMNQDMDLEDLDKMLAQPSAPVEHLTVPDKYKTPSEEEKAFREQIAAPSRHEEEAPESYEIPMPKVTPKPSARRAPARKKVVEPEPVVEEKPVVEEPVIEEAAHEDESEMMANITFSFNKKKPAMSGEEKPVSATAIPRQPEKAPERPQGMPMMNAEYESGYLNRIEVEHDVDEGEVREIVPNVPRTSENYVGSDENDRPLASRPAAPLARMRGDFRVELTDRRDLAPEDDETNRPLANRPPAPLARATESSGPSLEYLTEHELDDDIHAMPSIENRTGSRWGEMPEAKSTPAWAKPQETDDSPSPFRPNPRDRGRSHMSRDELRASEEDAVRRASASLAAHNAAGPRARTLADKRRMDAEAEAQEQERENSPFRPARPAAERPMGRPAERPSARAASEEPKKQVPIWERVPDTDGPIPAWGASAAFVDDERPRGSLMKPKGQIIDVEKPREGNGLWRQNESPKEVLLPGGARIGSAEEEEDERGLPKPEAREIAPQRPSRPQVERPAPPRGAAKPVARPIARPQVERPAVERPDDEATAARPSARPAAAARPAAERPAGRPSARPMGRPGNFASDEQVENRSQAVTEDESEPITFSSDRPRTYAQRRQMEEEERRRQIQSSFVNPERQQRAPIRRPSLRPADLRAELPEEDQPINKTFESEQFENKPSVVASLDMLPEPLGEESIHHLAKDSYTPALARGTDEIQEELAQGEKIAKKAMRGLPDYDPDGPSPFKPNRNR